MSGKSTWSTRKMECPGEGRKAELLLEWRVEKGKKVLNSISCDHPRLMDYSGSDCEWHCLKKLSRKKEA